MVILTCGVCGGDVGDPTEIDDFEHCHCTIPFIDEDEGEPEPIVRTACHMCGDPVDGPGNFCCALCKEADEDNVREFLGNDPNF